jgi:aminopeptidase N
VIDRVELRFELEEDVSVVYATLAIRRAAGTAADAPLVLDGEHLVLRSAAIDGRALAAGEYVQTAETLTIASVPDRFELRTVVAIRPQDNTELTGLYRSSGNYCTQCEAEGFRRITFFLDRPDVMATGTA